MRLRIIISGNVFEVEKFRRQSIELIIPPWADLSIGSIGLVESFSPVRNQSSLVERIAATFIS